MQDPPTLLALVSEEIFFSRNPYTSKETIVLRNLKRLTEETFNLSWPTVMETVRTGNCLLDPALHELVFRVVNDNRLADDAKVERILSRDYVKSSELSALAATFNKCLGPASLQLFAVDGYQGRDDLKRYVDNFKWDKEEWKRLHVQAVRQLYDVVDDVHATVTAIFQNVRDEKDSVAWSMEVDRDAFDAYVKTVGGRENVLKIGEWRLAEYKKYVDEMKRKDEQHKKSCEPKRKKVTTVSDESDNEEQPKKKKGMAMMNA